MRNGKNTMLYLGDSHREALDKIGREITKGDTKRGLKSKAVRHLIDKHEEKK